MKYQQKGERDIYVTAKQRDKIDVRKFGRALIDLAQLQLEAEAKAEHQRGQIASAKDASPVRPTAAKRQRSKRRAA